MATGEQVFTLSMALIDSMTSNGTLDGNNTKDYRGKAPSLLTIIQTELLQLESPDTTPTVINSLNDNLAMSDRAALMVAPYKLAAEFMLTEMNNDLFNHFNNEYQILKEKIRKKATYEDVVDAYMVGDLNEYSTN